MAKEIINSKTMTRSGNTWHCNKCNHDFGVGACGGGIFTFCPSCERDKNGQRIMIEEAK